MTTGEIVAHVLTEGTANDAQQVPDLLRIVEGTMASVTADGAYDGKPTYAATRARQPDPPPAVVIPPRASAVPSTADPAKWTAHDRHIVPITEKGRMEWQRLTGYGRRALAERPWPLEAPDRPPAARPHLHRPAGRGRIGRLGAEPHDPHRQARMRPRRLTTTPGRVVTRRTRPDEPTPFDTARYLSGTLGQQTIRYETQTVSQSSGTSTKPGRSSTGIGEHLWGRALLTPDEVMRLGPTRPIVLVSGEPPYLLHRVNYLTDPAYAGRFDANPLHLPHAAE